MLWSKRAAYAQVFLCCCTIAVSERSDGGPDEHLAPDAEISDADKSANPESSSSDITEQARRAWPLLHKVVTLQDKKNASTDDDADRSDADRSYDRVLADLLISIRNRDASPKEAKIYTLGEDGLPVRTASDEIEKAAEKTINVLDWVFRIGIVITFIVGIVLIVYCTSLKTSFDKAIGWDHPTAEPQDRSRASVGGVSRASIAAMVDLFTDADRIVNVTSACDSRPKSYNDTESHIRYIEGVTHSKTACLFLTGTILAILAFAFAGLLAVEEKSSLVLDVNGKPFLGSKFYYPPTISEFVSDPNSPCGKIFFAFVLCGCTCILISWYPWYFSNVHVGDGVWGNGLFMHLRSLLPPLGLLVVACIRVKASAQRTVGDHIASNVHTLCAIIAIGGYCAFEFLTLYLYHEGRQGPGKGAVFKPGERRVRLVITYVIAFGVIAFVGSMITTRKDFGNHDVWSPVTIENVQNAMKENKWTVVVDDAILLHAKQKGLKDVASGMDLLAKQISFWGEWVAGFAMAFSHLVIWYYCPERHVKFCQKPEAESETRHASVTEEEKFLTNTESTGSVPGTRSYEEAQREAERVKKHVSRGVTGTL